MSRAGIGAVLTIATSIAIGPLHAQFVAPPSAATFYHVSIGVGGGVTVPTGNSATPIENGWNSQAYVLIHLLPGVPDLRFNIGYSRSSYKNGVSGFSPDVPVSSYLGKQQEVLSGVGGLNINLLHVGPVTPYITAGIGAFDVRTTVDTAQQTSGSATTTSGLTQSTVDFGIDAGGGLSLALGRVSAFVEGRVQNVYTNGGGLIKSARHIMAVPISFGIAAGLF